MAPAVAILIDYSNDDAPYPDFPAMSLMTKCRIKDSVGRYMKEGWRNRLAPGFRSSFGWRAARKVNRAGIDLWLTEVFAPAPPRRYLSGSRWFIPLILGSVKIYLITCYLYAGGLHVTRTLMVNWWAIANEKFQVEKKIISETSL